MKKSKSWIKPRFILLSIAVIALLGGAAYGWRRYRAARAFADLERNSALAYEKKDWPNAAKLLQRYVQFRPHDTVALEHLAESIEKSAATPMERIPATNVYARLLRQAPDNIDLRLKLAELELITQPRSALTNAERILDLQKNNAAALLIKAQALDMMRTRDNDATSYPEVVRAFEAVVTANPGQVEAAARLATLYRTQASVRTSLQGNSVDKWNAMADRVIDTAVEKSDRPGEARLARYIYRKRFRLSQKKERDADLRKALELEPKNASLKIAVAEQLANVQPADLSGNPENNSIRDAAALTEAGALFQAAIEEEPNNIRARLGLARVQWARNNPKAALETLRSAVDAVGTDNINLNIQLIELMIETADWRDAKNSLDKLDQSLIAAGERHSPQVIARLRGLVNLLRADWLNRPANPESNPAEATSILKTLSLSADDRLRATAAHRLGQLYGTLGQWDLAVAAYKQASEAADAASATNRLLEADALSLSGQLPDAIKQFSQLLSVENGRLEILMRLARAELAMQLSTPFGSRSWSNFMRAIKVIRQAIPNSSFPEMLEIEAQISQGSPVQRRLGIRALGDARTRYREDADFWGMAFELYLRLDLLQDARAALERVENLRGLSQNVFRAQLAAATADLNGLQAAIASGEVSQSEQARLYSTMVVAAERSGKTDQIHQWLEALARKSPQQLAPRIPLVESAVLKKDIAGLDRLERELRTIEGTEGTYWRVCRIHRMLLASSNDPHGLQQAERLAEELTRARPFWSGAWVTAAQVATARQKLPEALKDYSTAYLRGAPVAMIARNCAALLTKLIADGANAEAFEAAKDLRGPLLASPELLPLALTAAQSVKQEETALDIANRAVAAAPGIPQPRSLRGQAHLRSRTPNHAAAEIDFREAIRLQRNDPVNWLSLLHLYANDSVPDRTLQFLEAARAVQDLIEPNSEGFSKTARAWMVARLLELEGVDAAGALYQTVIKAGSKEPLFQSLPGAAFLMGRGTQPREAPGTAELAKLSLRAMTTYALLLASREATSQTLEPIAKNPRLSAVALLCRGGPDNSRKASALLQENATQRSDQLLLARLFAADGAIDQAAAHWRQILKMTPTASNLFEFANFSLEQKRLPDAIEALRLLGDMSSADRNAINDLHMRLLHAQNRTSAAVQLGASGKPALKEGEKAPTRNILEIRRDADALATIGQVEAAINLFRDGIGDVRENRIIFAEWLSRRAGYAGEAVEMFLKDYQSSRDPRVLTLLAIACQNDDPKSERQAEANAFFTEAQRPESEPSSEFLAALALLHEHRRQPDAAIQLTRQALALRADDPVHLNNLAWFLTAYKGQHDEAISTIDRAIRLLGPSSSFVDTKGVALLNAGKASASARLLEQCLAKPAVPAAASVHLAALYSKMEDTNLANLFARRCVQLRKLPMCPFDEDLLGTFKLPTE